MMEMDVEPRNNIIALHGTRIPQVLGSFHLDDHNVQEWSDFNEAGMKHRARKEIGTWIDRDRHADIKFQRHEDSKRSDTSREQQRTEVIQGNAPDAQFQIIRSSRQFQDSDNKSGARVTSMSTSYQMSSTRGVRTSSKSISKPLTTKKTTSNKTTTKTVTVSGGGGGRSDDFENLKMSFQPLDTSTQRERINVSRSGTMGVRRPPTRRHTSAAAPATPENLPQESQEEEEDSKPTDVTATSILGLKNISSKIRVGFPVEIQLELQSKLRYSNGEEEENGVIIDEEEEEDDGEEIDEEDKGVTVTEIKDDEEVRISSKLLSKQSSTRSWHAQEGRPYQEADREDSKNGQRNFNHFHRPVLSSSYPQNKDDDDDVIKRLASNIRRLSPSPSLSRSWDLIQSVANQQEEREERKKIFLSSPHLDQWKPKGLPPQRSIVNLNPFEEFPPQDSLESPRRSPERSTALYASDEHFPPTFQRPLHKVGSTPDIIHHNNGQFESEKSPQKSRLMSLLNETPDLLNKMAFTSHNSNNKKNDISFNKKDLVFGKTEARIETKRKPDKNYDSDSDAEDMTERIQRLLQKNSTRVSSTDESFTLGPAPLKTPKVLRGDQLLEESMEEDSYRRTQVSHTWISASDKEKPSQRVRDNDVTTSISATSDPYRKLPKKVEFSKTEVHFTPDSGKFHIVETDENKPSTVHLFRRKKRKTSKEEKKMEILSKVLNEKDKKQSVDLESKSEAKTVDVEKEFGSERCDEELGIDEQTVTPTRINKDQRPSLSEQLSNYGDDLDSKFESEVDSEDDAQSDDIAALSNYGELKIQRYLKQLKYNNNSSDRLSPERLDIDDEDDELGQFRYDSAYENGSFVPLATRRSLIEMNNRNRTKTKTSSRISDNSSTTSNYSLPMSDAKGDDYSPTLKLKALEAIVDTSSPKPQITSIDLRYGFPASDSYFDGSPKRNFSTTEDEDMTDAYGEPVKPEIKSLPPFRSSRYFNQFDDGDDEEEENEESKFRPPMPIFPSKFSSFEKTGAALRERFNAKTTVRPKPEGREAPLVFLDGNKSNHNSSYIDSNVTNFDADVTKFDGNVSNNSSYIPSKSVVNIGGDSGDLGGKVKIRIDRSEQEEVENRRIDKNFDERPEGFQKFVEISSEDPISQQHVPEPILSMDHTWKGPAHFDSQIHAASSARMSDRATSVARSLTFPKSSRPEPEWVAKAKSRESRVKDWNLVGKPQQQFGAGRKAEPPWVTEIRFKSKLGGRTSPILDTKSLLVNSIVYPWEKDDKGAELFESSRHSQTPRHQEISLQVETPRHHERTRHHEVPTRHHGVPRQQDVPTRHHESNKHHEAPEPQVRVQSPEIIVPIRNEGNVTITELADGDPESLHEFLQKDSLDSDILDDDSNENVQKLLAPISERSKGERKPLQTSGQNRTNAIVLEKPRAPPRPPKPPQRVSSLTNKSAALVPPPPPLPPPLEKRVHLPGPSPPPATKRHHPAEKRSRDRLAVPSPSSLDRRSVSGSPSSEKRSLTPQNKNRRSSSYNTSSTNHHHATNNNRNNHANGTGHHGELLVNKPKSTPIHNHPLVKVAKIPSARPSNNSATAKAVASSDGKVSKNKAKHQVVTTTETKIACKSKLMDGQPGSGVVKETEAHSRMADSSHNSTRPLPKVPPPPTAPLLVSPHRNR